MVTKGVNKTTNRSSSKNSSASSGDFDASVISGLINEELIPAKEKIEIDLKKAFQDELNSYKTKTIEVLAVFVALFTFISVDIQIFKSDVSTLSAMGFTLLMLGSLIIFLLILVRVLGNKIESSILLFILSMMFIIAGVVCVGYDYKGIKNKLSSEYYTKEDADSKIDSVDTKKEVDAFKLCILKNQGYWPCVK